MVSWSVSAIAQRFAFFASAATIEGEKLPSEAVECVCKSIYFILSSENYPILIFVNKNHKQSSTMNCLKQILIVVPQSFSWYNLT